MTAKKAVKDQRRARTKRHLNVTRLPTLLFVVFLAYLLILVGVQFTRLATLEQGIIRAESELETIKKKNALLWEQVRLLESEAYVESLAREKLGLVKPGEVPVVITTEPEAGKQRE
ncbi:MAG: septum formation initiator family protein [Bacillota bacterium]|jgi:cell division protein FtsB|nr:septum formation initiator family protein [Thermoanaerobacteraceae bacterium]